MILDIGTHKLYHNLTMLTITKWVFWMKLTSNLCLNQIFIDVTLKRGRVRGVKIVINPHIYTQWNYVVSPSL